MPKLKLLSVLSASVFVAFSFFIFLPSASADITTGLVSHWKMDETSGTIADDSVGANNGTLTNGPAWTTGKINNGLSFDGINDQVQIPYGGVVGGNSAFTISFWYKTTSTTKGKVYSEGDSGISGRFVYFSANENTPGEMEFLMTADGTTYGGVNTGAIGLNNGQWHHAVGVQRNQSDRELFIDGVSKGRNTALITTPSLNIATIGALRTTTSTQHFNGSVDDVRVYNRALSATDISQLYNYTGTGASSSSSVQSAPTATTNSATNITQNTSTLNATVNPNNQSSTVYFQYGLTSSYGNQTPTQTLTGSTNQNITANISNLTANTVYYYRIVAQSNGGTTYGSSQTFTTQAVVSSSSSSVTTNSGLQRVGRWFTYNGQYKYLVGFDTQELAVDPSVDYIAALDKFVQYGINKTRIWIYPWFGGASYLSPWQYSNGKHNLDQWNTAYWQRVRDFVTAAKNRGIVVEISIFAPNDIDRAIDWSNTTSREAF